MMWQQLQLPGSCKRAALWIALLFAFKLALLLALHHDNYDPDTYGYIGHIARAAGDSGDYTDPAENFLSSGIYTPHYRMPGIAIVYGGLRLFLGKPAAADAFFLFQLLLNSIACYLLAVAAALMMQRKKWVFYTVLAIGALDVYVIYYTLYILSDSLCASTLVISFSCFIFFLETQHRGALFYAGLFAAWSVFCRPVYLPVLGIFSFALLIYNRTEWKKAAVNVIVILSAFIFFDSCWIASGYLKARHFSPLQGWEFEGGTGLIVSEKNSFNGAIFAFARASSADPAILYSKESPASLQYPGPYSETGISLLRNSVAKTAYTSYFNFDTLLAIHRAYEENFLNDTMDKRLTPGRIAVIERLNNCTESIKKEHAFLIHVGSRLIAFKRLAITSGTYNLFKKNFAGLNAVEKTVRLFYSFLYLSALALSFLAFPFWILYRRHSRYMWIALAVWAYSMGIYPFLRLAEYRYLVPVESFNYLLGVYVVFVLGDLISNRFRRGTVEVHSR